MVEPVTTGALVAGALSGGAAALAKGMLGEAAKDAYKKLKNAVTAWGGHDVQSLEQHPESAPREAIVAELVDTRDEREKAQIAALARALMDELGDAGRARAETRITVIATHGGYAAGGNQTFNYAPPPAPESKKGD